MNNVTGSIIWFISFTRLGHQEVNKSEPSLSGHLPIISSRFQDRNNQDKVVKPYINSWRFDESTYRPWGSSQMHSIIDPTEKLWYYQSL